MATVQPVRLVPVVPAYKDVALTGVYEISKILTTPQALDRCLGGVIAVLSSFMQMRRGYILVLDDSGEPELTAAMGEGERKPARARSLVPQMVIDQIVATGVPLVIESIVSHPLFTGSAYLRLTPPRTTVSFIGVPIRVDGKVKGVVTVDREWDGKLQFRLDDDVRLLTMVANLIGQTLRMHLMLARDRDRLISEKQRLEKQLSDAREDEARPAPMPQRSRAPTIAGIVGGGPAIRAVLKRVDAAARSNATVLLRGETGTG